MKNFDNLSEELITKEIKPSIQRIKILEYLKEHRVHPTAEYIYNELKDSVSSLSKATVYNTLALFAQKGLVRILTLENNENRYDINTLTHGHFICEYCGTVQDFDVDIEGLDPTELAHCEIRQKDVYFRGICAKCLSRRKS